MLLCPHYRLPIQLTVDRELTNNFDRQRHIRANFFPDRIVPSKRDRRNWMREWSRKKSARSHVAAALQRTPFWVRPRAGVVKALISNSQPHLDARPQPPPETLLPQATLGMGPFRSLLIVRTVRAYFRL